jgi:hypothetical protein
MKKLNRMVVVIALCALAAGSALAQERTRERRPQPHNLEVYKDLIATLKTWAQSNVMPQLRTWKSTLDGAMSADDLAKLNALRARASQLRKDAIATGLAMHQAWKSEDYDALKSHREKMKGYHQQRKALFEELTPLALEYRSTLEAIGAESKPKVAEWKKEGKEVAMQWVVAHKDEIGAQGLPHMRKMGKMMGLHGGMSKKVAAALFMLWDGGDILDQVQSLGGDGSGNPELD